MSLANWTTRILVGSAKGPEAARVEPGGPIGADALFDAPTQLAPASCAGRRIGTYQITKRLGAGGVGEVFKGVDVTLKREVAIKVLRDELAADPVFLARFRNEAQLQAKLNHPNVARVFAFLEEADKPVMVMEYVPGISLEDFVRSGGPVPVVRALHIVRRVLDGVQHAHSHGIVHRDLKPANIMLADSGEVKVMDFGIARALDSQEHLTRIGHVAGTAKVMSPEQIRGEGADVRSDIYSLGIVLYTLLAGRPPFDDENDLALMKAQLEQSPPPLRGKVAELPLGVDLAVMRALEKDPSARFQSARDFAAAIDACLADMGSVMPDASDGPDEQTVSRTIVNPVVLGIEKLPPPADEAGGDAIDAGPKRKLPWLGIGAGTMALSAVTVAVAWMWTQLAEPPTGVAVPEAKLKSTAIAAAAATPEPMAAPLPAPPLAAASQPATAPVATARSLTVSRRAADGQTAIGGVAVRPGERIQLQLVTSHDAHVYCYLQDENQHIVRFYPNRFHGSSLVKANAPLELPGRMRFEIVANAKKVPETVACFASEQDIAARLPASVFGADFAKLPVASLEEVRRAYAQHDATSLVEGRLGIDFK